ncbi:MAG: domain 2 [Pseudomonadota bacterium]|jgi:hypothetical protein
MTKPDDALAPEETTAFFRARYAALYRYANGLEVMGLVVGGGAGLVAGGIAVASLGERHGMLLLLSLVFIVVAFFVWLDVCKLIATVVRAFTDIAVSHAPGLDVGARLSIMRNSDDTSSAEPLSTDAPRERTDIASDMVVGMSAGRARAVLSPQHLTSRDGTIDPPAPATPASPKVPRGFDRPKPMPVATPPEPAPPQRAVTTPPEPAPAQPAPAVSPQPAPATPPPAWYVAWNGETTGPWEEGTLRQALADRALSAETLVWRAGDESGWVRLDADPALRRLLPPPA